MKTLFVRPKCEIGFYRYEYWKGFAELFPDPEKPWRAKIPPFENVGIEVVIIGHPEHSYEPMQSFTYDPAADPNKPHCDIMEIVCKGLQGKCPTLDIDCRRGRNSYCASNNHNYGHSYFDNHEGKWMFDTPGFTPGPLGPFDYRTPEIFPFALENYFNEGAYLSIAVGQKPPERTVDPLSCPTKQCYDESKHCPNLIQCYDFQHCSPLALNHNDPINGHPDGNVQFNKITFAKTPDDPNYKAITSVGAKGKDYDRKTTLRRIVVHEMGHALLEGTESDHCDDPECIMYGSVKDWEMREFGHVSPTGIICPHTPGGSKDIRANGVIHNEIH